MKFSLAVLILLLCYLQIDNVQSRRQIRPIRLRLCRIKRPVCGSDGNTYDNTCKASKGGATVKCRGKCPCKPVCKCPKILRPVCGRNGKTYSNSCLARCAGITTQCSGKCPCKPKIPVKPKPGKCNISKCPLRGARPVCGVNGKTYRSPCEALCRGVKIQCSRACPCRPTKPVKPLPGLLKCIAKCPLLKTHAVHVCGVNGMTYGSSCEARCSGVDVECSRRCPCRLQLPGPIGPGGPIRPGGPIGPGGPGCKAKCPLLITHPVCGLNGRTYGSSCEARCSGVITQCSGRCPCKFTIPLEPPPGPRPGSIKCFAKCPLLHTHPVCGANGITYGSRCEAACMKVEIDCSSPCPCNLKRGPIKKGVPKN